MGDDAVRDGKQTCKSAALQRATENMQALGVRHHHDVTTENTAVVKKAYRDTNGLGWVTFEYFLMLLGRPGIKPNTLIQGFINGALNTAQPELSAVRDRAAGEIPRRVYEKTELPEGMGPTDVDRTIWLWQRSR